MKKNVGQTGKGGKEKEKPLSSRKENILQVEILL